MSKETPKMPKYQGVAIIHDPDNPYNSTNLLIVFYTLNNKTEYDSDIKRGQWDGKKILRSTWLDEPTEFDKIVHELYLNVPPDTFTK